MLKQFPVRGTYSHLLQCEVPLRKDHRNVSPLRMEHLNRGGRTTGRPDDYDSGENEYHEPEEPVVLFYPHRTKAAHLEYADRRPVKIRPSQSGAEDFRQKVMDVPPQLPRRTVGNTAPFINRDLKPSRRERITPERRSRTLGCNEENITKIPPRPVRSLPRDQGSQSYPTATVSQNSHAFDLNVDSPPTRPPPNTPVHRTTNYTHTRPDPCPESSDSSHLNGSAPVGGFRNDSAHRHSLDLESHDLHRSYSKQGNTSSDSVRKHHEWPQVKGDSEHGSYTGHSKPQEASAEQDWYVGAFSRVEAEHALHLVNREGAFLVRDCSKNTTHEPFVLAIFYDNRVFNIQIRFCKETSKYSLGTRIKTNDTFDSVADIIKFHSIFPIMLIDGRNPSSSNEKRRCNLVYPVTVQDMNQLLS
ncbi:uncharacterized protein clnk isoform X4 [Brachyhypopomus gauderio]|uniref:uncharacterized protein clnk isoform X4 n=1 Tax=Brachyhypopomus gauderio TaxID=698409 RepID=UPI0040428E5E